MNAQTVGANEQSVEPVRHRQPSHTNDMFAGWIKQQQELDAELVKLAQQRPTLYEVLSIETDATTEEIRKAYLRKSRPYHPNKGETDADICRRKMELQAYEVLSDGTKRTLYDQGLGIPAQESHSCTRQRAQKLQQQVERLLKENGDLKSQNEALRSQQRDCLPSK